MSPPLRELLVSKGNRNQTSAELYNAANHRHQIDTNLSPNLLLLLALFVFQSVH
jgi:hypothetical protein